MPGFNKECGAPSILLMDEEHFKAQWVAREIPRRRGQRKNLKFYEVFNIRTRERAWDGSNFEFAHRLANRLSGWESAAYFAPPERGTDGEGK